MKKIGIIGLLCLAITAGAVETLAVQQRLKKAIQPRGDVRAEDLTLREQIGQTIMPRVFVGQQDYFKEAVLRGEVTGFFIKSALPFDPHFLTDNSSEQVQQQFAKERQELIKTIQDLQTWASQSRHKIPLLFAVDYEGGQITSPMYMGLKQMPSNMLLGAAEDESIITQAYDAQAKELLSVGANVAFGPVTDVNSNPQNPIIQARSFGENAADVGRKAALAVRALQANRVPAFNKHFPGHGDTATDTHKGETHTDLKRADLWNSHVSAFLPSIAAGVKGIMSAHVMYKSLDEGVNASLSPKVLKDLLQTKLKFDGVIATDGLDMGAVNGLSVEEVVRRAYKAGNHLLLLTSGVDKPQDAPLYARRAADFVTEHIQDENTEHVSAQEIENAAQKVIELKKWMGLLDGKPAAIGNSKLFDRMARRAAEEGVTLVRGHEKTLPLQQKQSRVCTVFFANLVFQKQLGQLNALLRKNKKQVQNIFAPVLIAEEEESYYANQIKTCLENADAVIIGTSGFAKKESMPGQYKLVTQTLDQAAAQQKKAILISLVSPYDIPLYPQAATVMALYGPTVDTVEVATEIILGKRVAKGKLPVELPL